MASLVAVLLRLSFGFPAPVCSVCRVRLGWGACVGVTVNRGRQAAGEAGGAAPEGRDLGPVFAALAAALAEGQARGREWDRAQAAAQEQAAQAAQAAQPAAAAAPVAAPAPITAVEERWRRVTTNAIWWAKQGSHAGALLATVGRRKRLARLAIGDEPLTTRRYNEAVAGTRWQRFDLRTGQDWWAVRRDRP